ncbi:hypothetical protein C4569_02810 [Candidatus Parcubacteria bacterium]|nr:MAG: hypothetical protein C4569_02810 [Candidatus Parcubacteria bacterium]
MKNFILQFTDLSSFLSLKPEPINLSAFKFLGGMFVFFLVLGFLFLVMAKKTKKDKAISDGFSKLFALFLTVGGLGLFYSWLAYENVLVLSARFVFAIIVLVFVIWLGFALKYQFYELPKIKQKLSRQKNFNKYLP